MKKNKSNLLLEKGNSLYQSKSGDGEALRMFELADSKYKDAAASCSTNPLIYNDWGKLLTQLAALFKERAIKFEEENPNTHFLENVAYCRSRDYFEKVAQVRAQVLNLNPQYKFTLQQEAKLCQHKSFHFFFLIFFFFAFHLLFFFFHFIFLSLVFFFFSFHFFFRLLFFSFHF